VILLDAKNIIVNLTITFCQFQLAIVLFNHDRLFYDVEQPSSLKILDQCLVAATEFSNASLGHNGLKEVYIADRESLEGLKRSSQQQDIEEDTDFDYAVDKFATKNSNLISNSAGRGI